MPAKPRERSEGNVYHVYARAVGRVLLFEDDGDREFFLRRLSRNLEGRPGEVLAWCLMSNHYHLLMRMELSLLSEFLRVTNLVYAQRFNRRYERVGHLFQGRFGSQAMQSEEQLLCALRYIHRNPVKAGICGVGEYRWSSYREYLGRSSLPPICNVAPVLATMGGVGAFIRFHEETGDDGYRFLDSDAPRSRTRAMPDSQAIGIGVSILGNGWRVSLPQEETALRNSHLRHLRQAGLSINQIERLTGISRGIIQRATVSNDRIP